MSRRPSSVPFQDKQAMDFGRAVGNASKQATRRASTDGQLIVLDDVLSETRLTESERRELSALRDRVVAGETLSRREATSIVRLQVAAQRRPMPEEAPRGSLLAGMTLPKHPPGRGPVIVTKAKGDGT